VFYFGWHLSFGFCDVDIVSSHASFISDGIGWGCVIFPLCLIRRRPDARCLLSSDMSGFIQEKPMKSVIFLTYPHFLENKIKTK